MLRASCELFVDLGQQEYYLFNVIQEEVTFSIPLTYEEAVVVGSCLESVIYQNIENIYLEMCKASIDRRRNTVVIMFTHYAPMLSFTLQRSEAINVLNDIKKITDQE